MRSAPFVSGGEQHQLVHYFRMTNGDLQSGRAAIAETHDVCFVDLELLEQCRHVVGVLLKTQRPVDVRSVPVRLQLDGDDAMRFGEFRQHAPICRFNCRSSAVNQHQRPAAAVNLVIHLQTIHLRIMTGLLRLGVHLQMSYRHKKQNQQRFIHGSGPHFSYLFLPLQAAGVRTSNFLSAPGINRH